jgi:hypothetical protein
MDDFRDGIVIAARENRGLRSRPVLNDKRPKLQTYATRTC